MDKLALVLLATWLGFVSGAADIDDNLVLSKEMIRALLEPHAPKRLLGQPEIPDPLALPSDEDSYNELLNSLENFGDGDRPGSASSGTHHFVSSTFPEIDARGFHESVFDGFGDYYPPWKRHKLASSFGKDGWRGKRDPLGFNARGFHEDVFNTDFGAFHPMKRSEMLEEEDEWKPRNARRGWSNDFLNMYIPMQHTTWKRSIPEVSAAGQNLEDLGTFSPVRKKRDTDGQSETENDNKEETKMDRPEKKYGNNYYNDALTRGFGNVWGMKRQGPPLSTGKRRPEMDSSGFHGDTFSNGFGDFYTMKKSEEVSKRRPEMDSSGFHGDTFSNGFGDFYTMKRNTAKRRPEMDSSGFYGDTFSSGFGDFYPMKKRRPEMDSSGFHGDTFSNGFGDFYTMKKSEEVNKRRPEMDSSGFHGDTFSNGFGDFYTMKRKAESKRRPEMDSSGFYGDTFSSGFGDFYPMKKSKDKRRPEMDSSGFHGDTFSNGFGDFYTMKRADKSNTLSRLRLLLGKMEHKRRPEMDSSGFYGDTFSNGFGDFYTMKKRETEHLGNASGPNGTETNNSSLKENVKPSQDHKPSRSKRSVDHHHRQHAAPHTVDILNPTLHGAYLLKQTPSVSLLEGRRFARNSGRLRSMAR